MRLLADGEVTGEPEVAHVRVLSFGLVAEEDVGGLYVSVHEPRRVRAVEGLGDLPHDVDRALWIQSALPPEALAQVDPLHVLHREVEHAVFLARVEDRNDVGVIEARRELRLPQEAPSEALVLCEIAAKHLQRDPAPSPRILGQENAPHGAFANQ